MTTKAKPNLTPAEEDRIITATALSEEQKQTLRSHKLTERGLLLRLKASRFNNKRVDRAATSDLCADKRANTSAVQVAKQLVSKEHLSPVTTQYNKMRDIIRTDCLPWDGTGWVFVPIGVYQKVRAALSEAMAAKDEAVNSTADNWERIIDEQKAQLGDLFDANDYPSPNEFRQAWTADVEVQQIPNTDIRVEMGEADADDLAGQVQKMVATNMSGVFQSATTRLAESLDRASGVLCDKGREPGTDGPNDKGKRVAPVHETMLDNLRTQTELVRELGEAVGDKDMLDLCKRVEKDLLNVTVEQLRKDPERRAKVGTKAAVLTGKAKMVDSLASSKVDDIMSEVQDFM